LLFFEKISTKSPHRTQVLTMLMGEYDYYANFYSKNADGFVDSEASNW
jgi:hypothetical protein